MNGRNLKLARTVLGGLVVAALGFGANTAIAAALQPEPCSPTQYRACQLHCEETYGYGTRISCSGQGTVCQCLV